MGYLKMTLHADPNSTDRVLLFGHRVNQHRPASDSSLGEGITLIHVWLFGAAMLASHLQLYVRS